MTATTSSSTPATPAFKIGPTFGAELLTAGCRLDFSWNSLTGVLNFPAATLADGVTPNPGAFSASDVSKIESVFSAHDPAAVPVPQTVTNYQARHVLILAGYFAAVDKAITSADPSIQGNQIALNAWEYANVFNRSDPIIAAMAAVIPLTEAQIDQLFIQAQAY